MEMKPKSAKFLFPLALIILGIVWIYVSLTDLGFYGTTEPKAGFFPCIMASVMIIISLIDLFYTLHSEKTDFSWFQFMPIIGLFIAIACSYLIGTIPALALFLLLWLRVLEKYSWKITLITTAVTVLFIWGVFDYWVRVNFQTGLLWKMIF